MTKLIPLAISLLIVSCATAPAAVGMRLCYGTESSSINEEVLKIALIKAEEFALERYGKDCVTCAELYAVGDDTFRVHITSPGDLLINTSATMEFDASTATVINSGVSHSCYVKYKR
jgi:hypothetical protein